MKNYHVFLLNALDTDFIRSFWSLKSASFLYKWANKCHMSTLLATKKTEKNQKNVLKQTKKNNLKNMFSSLQSSHTMCSPTPAATQWPQQPCDRGAEVIVPMWPWPFDLWVNACWATPCGCKKPVISLFDFLPVSVSLDCDTHGGTKITLISCLVYELFTGKHYCKCIFIEMLHAANLYMQFNSSNPASKITLGQSGAQAWVPDRPNVRNEYRGSRKYGAKPFLFNTAISELWALKG